MTWDDIEEVLFLLGFSPDTVSWMTLREVGNAVSGFYKNKEDVYKLQWEMGRFISFHSLLPHTKKNKKLKLTDVVKFPWDKVELSEKSISEKKERLKYLEQKWRRSINA